MVSNSLLNLDGFFDAGMLLQALKKGDGSGVNKDGENTGEGGKVPRKSVGKKLRLSEY